MYSIEKDYSKADENKNNTTKAVNLNNNNTSFATSVQIAQQKPITGYSAILLLQFYKLKPKLFSSKQINFPNFCLSVIISKTETKNFFLHYLCPIDLNGWLKMRWYSRMYAIFCCLPFFFLNLCIPVVDQEQAPENRWCRLLTVVNIFAAPQAALYLIAGTESVTICGVFPVWALLLCISPLFALIVLLTSHPTEPPPVYQPLFAFVGFAVGVIFINALSGEIVALLSTIGVLSNLSDSLLGMTLLAWGNCLGDLVSDVAMAKAGYPSMALAAAFSGPMFSKFKTRLNKKFRT